MVIMDEAEFGAQIRRARLLADIDQRALAAAANISPGTLISLESGKGSSLRTLIKVLRVLGRDDWLETLEPAPTVSPIALAREAAGLQEPKRVSRRRS